MGHVLVINLEFFMGVTGDEGDKVPLGRKGHDERETANCVVKPVSKEKLKKGSLDNSRAIKPVLIARGDPPTFHRDR